jgi:cell division protein FtsQ
MQIYVDENGELLLIPRVGDQKIVFGKTDNIIKKFDKLSLFYRKGIVGNGWKKYSTINLKFKNQIVCTKK